jgi:hypothetical protein
VIRPVHVEPQRPDPEQPRTATNIPPDDLTQAD